jgi:hypothetical protein
LNYALFFFPYPFSSHTYDALAVRFRTPAAFF